MEAVRTGVYVCWCGSNIAKMVDVEAVAKWAAQLPGVAVARDYKYMCSDPGQDMIVKDIRELKLNRVVVAACSPRIHEPTFRKALEKAGLNPYFFEMANIREQDSWVHEDRAQATHKAQALIASAVKRVAQHDALDKRTVDIHPASLVMGGGVAGLTAALEIADAGKQVFLVEKSAQLGGRVAGVDQTFPFMNSARQLIVPMIQRVQAHAHIRVFLNCKINEIFGYVGNFETTINGEKLLFGNIVVATGLRSFDPGVIPEYGYGRIPDVITSHEFEQMLLQGNIATRAGQAPRSVAIIHCVGSRNPKYHPYCSRTCCMTALKYANQIRSALPGADVFQIYADMRSMGKGCEEFYARTSRQGVMFLMFDQHDGLPRIRPAGGEPANLSLEFKELLSGEEVEVPADLVVLMVGMEAHPDSKDVAHAVGVSRCGNDFFIEKHPKLDPVATTTDGVYIAGNCQSPKDIPDAVSQAKAAAARILATIKTASVNVEVTTAVVNEDLCCGCQTCVKVCPYNAISFLPDKKVSFVNDILCKSCGTCGAACPTGAIRCRHFTDQQILSQIEGIMTFENEVVA